MKLKKGMRALSLLLVMILAGAMLVPAVSANEQVVSDAMIQVDPETDVEGYVPVDLINIDPSVKEATPYYYLLTLSDEGKKNFLKDIDSCVKEDSKNDISTDELTKIKESLNQLWNKYPVITEVSKGDLGYPSYGGTFTTIKFSSSVKSPYLSNEENELLQKAQTLLKNSYDQNQANQVAPKWSVSSHERISYWAAHKCLFPNENTVAIKSKEPDSWPPEIPEPFKTVFRSINHYYSPAGIGNAPNCVLSYSYDAKSDYENQDYSGSATNLGYSLHFLEDVGNPMHTGKEWEQFNNRWVHDNYEIYVATRWDSSNFEYTVSSNNNYFWYTNWHQGTIDLAGYSNAYLDTIYTKIYNKGQNWNYAQDSSIDAVSQNVIQRSAKFANGLARYIKIG